MEFCPSCGMLLQIESARDSRRMRLFCPTCPYVCPLQNTIVKKVALVRKEIEPIYNVADAMKLAATTEASCPRCPHKEAHFRQVQTRSADEPMTEFYQCCECGFNWKVG